MVRDKVHVSYVITGPVHGSPGADIGNPTGHLEVHGRRRTDPGSPKRSWSRAPSVLHGPLISGDPRREFLVVQLHIWGGEGTGHPLRQDSTPKIW